MEGLICFAGAPGVGKTTQALRLQEVLDCGYAPEFAREIIARYGYPKHAAFQLHAAYQQRDLEIAEARRTGLAVTDTATWMCYLYPELFNAKGACEQEQKVIEDLAVISTYWHRFYTHTFYLPLHGRIEADGIRDPHASPYIDERMRRYLGFHGETLQVTYVPEGLDEHETHLFVLDTLGVKLRERPSTSLKV